MRKGAIRKLELKLGAAPKEVRSRMLLVATSTV